MQFKINYSVSTKTAIQLINYENANILSVFFLFINYKSVSLIASKEIPNGSLKHDNFAQVISVNNSIYLFRVCALMM